MNLRTPEGQAIVHQLCRTADVVICNFRDDAARRLGVDYETLSGFNPRLICGQVTAFGSRGPDREKPAYHLVVQARTGILGSRRWPDGTPLAFPVMVSDMAAAAPLPLHQGQGYPRDELEGCGQKAEVSLHHSKRQAEAETPVELLAGVFETRPPGTSGSPSWRRTASPADRSGPGRPSSTTPRFGPTTCSPGWNIPLPEPSRPSA